VRRLAVTALAVVGLLAVGRRCAPRVHQATRSSSHTPLDLWQRPKPRVSSREAGSHVRSQVVHNDLASFTGLDTNEVCATLSVNPADLKEFKADLLSSALGDRWASRSTASVVCVGGMPVRGSVRSVGRGSSEGQATFRDPTTTSPSTTRRATCATGKAFDEPSA